MIIRYEGCIVNVDYKGEIKSNMNGLIYADNFYLTESGFFKNEGNCSLFDFKGELVFSLIEIQNKNFIIIHNQERYFVNKNRILKLIGCVPNYEIVMGDDEYVLD